MRAAQTWANRLEQPPTLHTPIVHGQGSQHLNKLDSQHSCKLKMWDICKKKQWEMTLSYITFVLCNNFIFKCLFVSVTKVSVHFLICFYLLKVSKTEIFANIFADVISEGSWWRQQQQHLVHSVHYCPIMRHTPWQTCNPCLTKPSCLHNILTRKVQQRIPLDNMAFSDC